ncbi:MAG: SIMPL domain-containing protein [Alphaproteobacteria bacterium]|nr:MAG: SIMPL domain-containing protein [Alphaproteobacteria bacterium]
MNKPAPPRRPTATALAATLAATLATAAPMSPSLAAERPLAERPLPVLRVQGEGEKTAAPDMAILSFSVLREADTARQALDANNEAMAAVIAAVRQEGIEARDIQTSGFSIEPRYTQPPHDGSGDDLVPRIAGYSVTNSLTVRLRDLARLGAILDKVVSLGVNAGGGIAFTNADTSSLIAEARAAAMKDAADRARTLAQAAGVRLGQIIEISESYVQPYPAPIARAKMMDAAAMSVPVESGENSYSVTVQVSWEILQ